jgi:hypothetical protein
MKSTSLLFCFSLLSILTQAQSWAPPGATWYYEIVHPFSSLVTYARYESIGDTVLLGQNCRIITQTTGSSPNDYMIGRSNTAYTYEMNGKIYVYNPGNSNFSLIYDFAADSGDTWITTWDTCSYQRLILRTDSIVVNGYTLKTLSYGSSTIIEGIGGDRTLFEALGEVRCDPPDTIVVEVPFVQRLRCYQDSVIGIYSTGVAPSCDFITAVHQLSQFENFGTLSPNPATSTINLQLKDKVTSELYFSIYNCVGQNMKSTRIENENTVIDLDGFMAGIYFVIISDDSGMRYTEKIMLE